MQDFVIVSGLPGSGKSRLGRALAEALDWPLLDKDDFLESLFEAEGIGDVDNRRRQSMQADVAFQASAVALPRAVLVSWWRHPAADVDSGTPIDWIPALSRPFVEVHCKCPLSIAAQRFLERKRHPGHLDERWSAESLRHAFSRHAELGALFPEIAITVNTETTVDVPVLVASLSGGRAPG